MGMTIALGGAAGWRSAVDLLGCETRGMGIRRSVLGGALVAGMALAAVVTGGTPAAAEQWGCTFYLFTQGYSGKIVDMGCAAGADGNLIICEGSLRIAGVPDAIGREACRRAAL